MILTDGIIDDMNETIDSLVESSFDHFTSVGTVPNIAYAVFGPIKILDMIYGLLDKVKLGKGLNLSHSQRLAISNFCKTVPSACKALFESGASIKPTGRTDYKKIYNFLY